MEKLDGREAKLHEAMAAAATDAGRLRELEAERTTLAQEREALEAAWMAASELLEG